MNTLVRRIHCRARTFALRPYQFGSLASKYSRHIAAPFVARESKWRLLSTATAIGSQVNNLAKAPLDAKQTLPWSCPGCGAYSQTDSPDGAGYFSINRRPVKAYLAARSARDTDDGLTTDDIPTADGIGGEETPFRTASGSPVCDRCHGLLHHNKGVSVEHPTLEAIQGIFSESPYRYNHVYQIVDAADFPMSLIPRLQEKMQLSPQRALNRRARHAKFLRGRVAEMSFIITRSDLLAPRKEQVDHLMPTLIDILRSALGRNARNVRLGNVRCVSAHRGWWTKEVKDEVWKRGGGGWMVGKVNVGKSNLIENILPKGRLQPPGLKTTGQDEDERWVDHEGAQKVDKLDEGSDLLPPRPPGSDYPVLPVVSHLSGTTAGPIRIPFGNGRGELIDLPGLARGGLEELVKDEHRESLIMKSRVSAEQVVIRPWQSLVISNLIRITPTTHDLTFLANPFLKLDYHITNTEKACEILAQQRNHVVQGIAKAEVAESIASAGTFKLKWDVTRQRAGPLTASDAVGLDPHRLPFVVFAMDLLVESVGWVEISAQMRRKDLEEIQARADFVEGDQYPAVEVFSPHGKHIGQRQTLNAWLMGGRKATPVSRRKSRPRLSVKGQKKSLKKQQSA